MAPLDASLFTTHTERLYWTAPELARFEARVLDVATGDDGHALVVLDRTAFFPEGGGQPADHGRLADARVVHVSERGPAIVHHLDGPAPAPGATIDGEVDLERRRDHSRQHSAQHIISALALARSGARTVGFHLGAVSSSVDLALDSGRPLDLRELERSANDVIAQDLPIGTTLEAADGTAEFRTARTVDEGELLRRVAIGELVTSLCCGTHVTRTGQIGLIKLGRTERVRDAVRLVFWAGSRCLTELERCQRVVRELGELTSAGPDDLVRWASAAQQEQRDLRRQVGALQLRLAGLEAERLLAGATELPGARLVQAHLEHDLRGLKEIAKTLADAPRVIALLGSTADGRAALLFARSADLDVDVAPLLAAAARVIGARGGGRPAMAQAGGGDPARLAQALTAAAEAVAELVTGAVGDAR